jgi:hypothetical protein
MAEGNLEVKSNFRQYMGRWTRRGGKRQRREREKEDPRKESETLCFSKFLGLRRVEGRLAKAAGAEPSGEMRDEKMHALVAPNAFSSQ